MAVPLIDLVIARVCRVGRVRLAAAIAPVVNPEIIEETVQIAGGCVARQA